MTNGYLFREYIGAQFTGVQFTDVPINAMLVFHYILAFAIDYTPVKPQTTPTPTNGVFSPFWDTGNLSPSAVAAVKAAHPNVAVMVGIGGDSVQDITKAVFTPTSVDSWVSNAVTSLTGVINSYGLDGVDVDYEHLADGADVDTFVECIGRLLTQLKKNMPWIKTSIAPFDDAAMKVQKYYQPLWRKYSGVIDYVNYQFYGYGANTDGVALAGPRHQRGQGAAAAEQAAGALHLVSGQLQEELATASSTRSRGSRSLPTIDL